MIHYHEIRGVVSQKHGVQFLIDRVVIGRIKIIHGVLVFNGNHRIRMFLVVHGRRLFEQGALIDRVQLQNLCAKQTWRTESTDRTNVLCGLRCKDV